MHWTRIGVGYLTAVNLALGAWATVGPKSYFEDFPGGGRSWVAGDGPYNEHLMRDYGALNLALGVLGICTLVWSTRQLLVSFGLVQITYAIPHVAYHLAHLDRLGSDGDQVAAVGGLVAAALIGAALLRPSGAGTEPVSAPR